MITFDFYHIRLRHVTKWILILKYITVHRSDIDIDTMMLKFTNIVYIHYYHYYYYWHLQILWNHKYVFKSLLCLAGLAVLEHLYIAGRMCPEYSGSVQHQSKALTIMVMEDIPKASTRVRWLFWVSVCIMLILSKYTSSAPALSSISFWVRAVWS